MRHASGHNRTVRSLIVDVAMGQIPRSTERISSFLHSSGYRSNTVISMHICSSGKNMKVVQGLGSLCLLVIYALRKCNMERRNHTRHNGNQSTGYEVHIHVH